MKFLTPRYRGLETGPDSSWAADFCFARAFPVLLDGATLDRNDTKIMYREEGQG